MECVICNIANGSCPARIVHQDEYCVVFIPLELNTRGHVVVAPILHCENIFDIDPDVLARVIKQTQRVAEQCRTALGATGVNVLHASGQAAQQSVMHFYLHILPRYEDDGLDAWPALPEWEGDLDELLAALKGKETGDHHADDLLKYRS